MRALSFVVVLVAAAGCHGKAKEDPVSADAGKTASAFTNVHTSENRLAVAHFPAAFRVSDVAIGKRGSIIRLEREDGSATLEILADAEPSVLVPRDAEKLIHEHEAASWRHMDAVEDSVERSDGKCLGQDAAIAVRKVTVHGKATRQWTCTFVHNSHVFRLMSWFGEARAADEEELRKILEATEIR